MKIFLKVFLLLVLVSALPLGATALLVMQRSTDLQAELLRTSAEIGEDIWKESSRALEEHAKSTHLHIVRGKASHLTNFFDNIGRATLLQTLLTRKALDGDPAVDDPPIYEGNEVADLLEQGDNAFAEDLFRRRPYVTYWRVRDVPQDRVEPTLPKLRPLGLFFAHNQANLPGCMSTYIGHRDGFILGYPGSRNRYPDAYDPRKRPWYLRAVEKRSLVWTPVYLDRNKIDFVITCSHAVSSGDSSGPAAVAAVDVKITQLLEDLFNLGDIPVDAVALIDADEMVRVGSVLRDGRPQIDPTLAAEPQPVASYAGGAFSELIARWSGATADSSGVFVAGTLDSKTSAIFAYGTIRLSGGPSDETGSRWVYAVKLPAETIFGPIRGIHNRHQDSIRSLSLTIEGRFRTLLLHILAGSAFMILLILLIAWRFARSTTQPLVRMSEIAQRIGRGELDQQVEVGSKDEIGQMGRAINDMIKGLKERDFVKNTFKMYVAGSVVEQLLKNPERIQLGGEKRVLTVFFSDLANFTTLAEKMTAEELVQLVNEYLEAMTNAIWEHEGTIDKYGGDSIMAFWGAPVGQEDHAKRACLAALANLERLKKLWPSWERRGLPLLQMRIGINTGAMIVGNMGSSVKRDYTVLGDPVNLGSRLEGVNKEYGTHIVISESTRLAAGDAVEARELDLIAVKGKKEAIRIFELAGLPARISPEHRKGLREFEAGLKAYRERDWDGAEAAFRRTLELMEDDAPSQVFLKRVAVFRQAPPPPDWNGTFVMKEK